MDEMPLGFRSMSIRRLLHWRWLRKSRAAVSKPRMIIVADAK
jgi:hypothetical protein